jgi:hypothetical protein
LKAVSSPHQAPTPVVEVQSDVAVSLDTGTAVLAGVTFDSTNGSQVARVTGANSNVIIRSPGEVFIPASVAASQGIQLFAGTARSDHSDYFKSLVPATPPFVQPVALLDHDQRHAVDLRQ